MDKLKNIKINEEVHTRLKTYCSSKGLKVGRFVEHLILSSIQGDQKDENSRTLQNN